MRLIRKPSLSIRRTAKARIPVWRLLLGGTGRAFTFALLMMTLAGWLYGVSLLKGFAVGFALLFGLFLCLIVYNVIRARVRLTLLRNESRDLALARKSAGLEGGVIRCAPMTLWLSGPKDWAPLVLDQFDEARTRFAALVGEPVAVEHPLRVLLFSDRAWFLQYACGARLVLPSGLDGFYLAGTPGKIVASMPNPLKRLAQTERFFQILLGYYLLNGFKGFPIHPWLNIGVAWLVAREPTAGEQARVNRKVLPGVGTKTDTRCANALSAQSQDCLLLEAEARRSRGIRKRCSDGFPCPIPPRFPSWRSRSSGAKGAFSSIPEGSQAPRQIRHRLSPPFQLRLGSAI